MDEKQLFPLMLDALSEGVVRISETGRVLAVNRAACSLFDISEYPPPAGRMIGLTVLEATHLRAFSELCTEVQQTGETKEADIRLVGRSERTLRIRALPIPTNSGTGCLALLDDRTELLKLQTVRTDFVANVSHELRTPLASIRATAETLLDGAIHDEEYSTRFLETIIRESDRLVRLSEDLLELARAESSEREAGRFDIVVLVQEVCARLLSYAERREVSVQVPAPRYPLWLSASRHEIDQVLFNLLDNAIKYTPGGGTVTVTLEERSTERLVAVTVRDTGIGMLSQDLPRIFERFWRADRARRFQSGEGGSGTGGTGLGLSIVKHIVEAHGGTVTAESELGQGSAFTVVLPLAAENSGITKEPTTVAGRSPDKQTKE